MSNCSSGVCEAICLTEVAGPCHYRRLYCVQGTNYLLHNCSAILVFFYLVESLSVEYVASVRMILNSHNDFSIDLKEVLSSYIDALSKKVNISANWISCGASSMFITTGGNGSG